MRRCNFQVSAAACLGEHQVHPSWGTPTAAVVLVPAPPRNAVPAPGCSRQDSSRSLLSPLPHVESGGRGPSFPAHWPRPGSADDLLGYFNRILERSAFASVEFRQALDILDNLRAFVLEILSQGPQHHPGAGTVEHRCQLVKGLDYLIRNAQRNMARSGVVVRQDNPPLTPQWSCYSVARRTTTCQRIRVLASPRDANASATRGSVAAQAAEIATSPSCSSVFA